ncbi:dTMP kinase [Natranaerovirga hydrolytica]|uniref:Thymidylate kinase n=1 Tax=Natranaerovirga hydrolytica TaxID=680378 RepID=A0A4R1NA45_9FIRM|nr:dTMP kinase [Natranaerovirga hydrolytica]TCL00035.1 dTMP kinase [Natranaerovirga hydrolytica]
MQGLFITIEGSDGSGKSTQLNLLKEYLLKNNMDHIFTREPGGTKIGEDIRSILLSKENDCMDDKTEVLLYAASRAQHVQEKIKPALQQGKIVISDRFIDSSLVYQGFARGIGLEQVGLINNWAIGGLMPDITFLLDLDYTIGLTRKEKQKDLDRLELEKDHFHEKVVNGYRHLKDKYPKRIIVLDATQDIKDIHNSIVSHITNKINKSQ